MTPIIFALDIGNGFVKGRYERKSINDFPSLVTSAHNVIQFEGFATSNDLVIEYGGQHWALGRSALRLSNVVEPNRGRGRMLSDQYLLLFLGALTQLYKQSVRPDKVVLVVPIAWYQNDRQALKEFLGGVHQVGIVEGGETIKWIEYDIDPGVISIIPEGFATLARETITTDGVGHDRHGLSTAKVGICNLGTFTTDCIFLDRMDIVPAKCDGREIGVSNVWEELRRLVRKEYDRELDDYEVDELVHQSWFMDSGEKVDMAPEVEASLQATSTHAINLIRRLWQDGREADHLLIAGGAGTLFFPYIQDEFPHAQLVEKAINSEVDGAYRYGLLKALKAAG